MGTPTTLRSALAIAAVAWAVGAPPAAAAAPAGGGLIELVGALHEHSGYSDGRAGTRPADSYASGRARGIDFMGTSEHAEILRTPFTLSGDCLDLGTAHKCVVADGEQPLDAFRKWDATLEQAGAATRDGFIGLRGFEWSSTPYGHVNVFFSRHFVDSYTDGSQVGLARLWEWFLRDPGKGGGADGLMTLNHPGYGDNGNLWDDYAYVPDADERVVGLEVLGFGRRDYGSQEGGRAPHTYARALDKGWHLGAIGAEDEHEPTKAGAPDSAKTVVLARDRSPAAIREALLARRFYAVQDSWRRLRFQVGGAGMGSRVARRAGRQLKLRAVTNDPEATVEIVTSGNRIVATGSGEASATRRADQRERWYFARVRRPDAKRTPVAYASPVWVTTSG